GVFRAVLLASAKTHKKLRPRKQRTYRRSSLRGEFLLQKPAQMSKLRSRARPALPRLQSTSEDQLDPQLDLARGRACARNPAVSRIDVSGPGHSALTEDGTAGKRKVGVVWNVEHLSPELNRFVFRKFHSLQERKVQVRQPRTGQNISAEVAVKSNRG